MFQKSKRVRREEVGSQLDWGEGSQEEGGRRQSLLHTSVVVIAN